jgi:hypothetical protein
MKKYALEVYAPDTIEDVVGDFESDTPFMSINIGDILNNQTWENANFGGKLLRVVRLEHFIWKSGDDIKHKIGVMTELVENNKNARME